MVRLRMSSQLQAGEAQAPQILAAAAEGVHELTAVAVADHVVGEYDESLPRQVMGCPELSGVFSSPSMRPMAVRAGNRGNGPLPAAGRGCRDERSGRLSKYLRDGVVAVADLSEISGAGLVRSGAA